MNRWPLILAAILCLAASDDPADHLKNPRDEARAEALFREVRCPVCQGESIAESDAPLAGDLRRVIRNHIALGASNESIRKYLSARYGDFALFRPWVSRTNALLWSGPFLVALAGLGWLIQREKRRPSPTPELSADEEARLDALERTPDNIAPELSVNNVTGLTER